MASIPPEDDDVIIVGAGAAGLSAALLLARAKLKVVVVSERRRRNDAAEHIHSAPFIEGARPHLVYAKMEDDAASYGVRFVWDEAVGAEADESAVTVSTVSHGKIAARRLLLANGTVDVLPSWLPSGSWGKNAFDCPYCHTFENDGNAFACVGPDAEALENAILAQRYASSLIVVTEDASAADTPLADRLRSLGAEILVDSVVEGVDSGDGCVGMTTKTGRQLSAQAILLSAVKRPNRKLAELLGLKLTARGYPDSTPFGRTSNPRVWTAGNRSGTSYFLWTGAASSGLNAARSIYEDIAFGAVRSPGRII